MKPPELWSLLVFIAGVTIGTIGTILAIVFGVENSKTQQCVCNGATVELFSVRTEIQQNFMSWDERFANISSTQYQAAVRNISQTLTAALMANDVTQISSYAALSNKTMASVQVARLSEGKNNSIVSFAYGVVYGDESSASLPSYADIQSKLDSDTKVVYNATVDSVSSPSTDPCAYQLPASTMRPKTTSRAGTTPKNLLPSSSTGMSRSSHSTILPTTSPATNLSSTFTRPTSATSPAVTVTRKSTSTMPSKGTSSTPSASSVSSTRHSPLANATAIPSTVIPTRIFTSSTYPPLTTDRTTSPTSHPTLSSHPVTTTVKSSVIPAQSSTAPANASSPTPRLQSTPYSTTTEPRTSTFPPASTGTSTLSTPTRTSTYTPSSAATPSSTPSVTSVPTRSTRASTHTPSSHPSTSSSTVSPSTPSSTATTSSSSSTAAPSTPSSTATPSTYPVTSTTTTMSTSSIPSTSSSSTATTTSSTLPPTTSPCVGDRKYRGDIAVAFELTTNTDFAAVESFVTTLLTYDNNPYSFSSDGNNPPSAYILVPYPNTEHYNPQNMYGRLRETDLNVSLSTFNVLLSLQPQTNATMDEAFNFIHGVKQRSSARTVILVGVSDAFVQTAQQSAKQLAGDGYNIFTVSIGVADFSSLATNKSFVHVLVSPSSSVEATMIATEIGNTLVQESSVCFLTPQSTTTTAAPSARSTSSRPYSTTSACKTPFIQQDIAFVVEISTSTGNLEASHAASNFITQYLIQQSPFDDLYSNFAIVPFPNASSYTLGGGVQDFGHLLEADFPLVFQMIFSVYSITNGAVSDIESGLRYAMEFEFPRLHDVNPRTILLFANSDDGVQAALEVSSELKAKDVNIVTVRMSDSDNLSLQPLSSAPDYNWNLPVSDTSSYSLMAEVISRKLLDLGSVCVEKP